MGEIDWEDVKEHLRTHLHSGSDHSQIIPISLTLVSDGGVGYK